MFDTTHHRVVYLRTRAAGTGLPDPEGLRERCLGSASRWELQRRANRAPLPPRRLPRVAPAG